MVNKERLVELAERVARHDNYLIDYLLGWTGKGPEQPWGAAHGFALEMGHGYGLIRGECDPTPTEHGIAVAEILRARAAQQEAKRPDGGER